MTIDGEIVVDDGAIEALKADASLLSKGVINVNKTFDENSGVEVKSSENELIARGVVNFSLILGRRWLNEGVGSNHHFFESGLKIFRLRRIFDSAPF